MRARPLLQVAAGLLAATALAWWLWPHGQELLRGANPVSERAASESLPADAPAPTAAIQGESPAEPSPPAGVAASNDPGETTAEAHPDAEHAPAETADLLQYARRPMSAVPHRVVRAWGAGKDPSQLGLVGAYVIVEPGIGDAQLIQLCRDIQRYHGDAKALSVRILDSEEAASYDLHTDGGAFKQQHQVAAVTRDAKLGVDAIYLRGELVKP